MSAKHFYWWRTFSVHVWRKFVALEGTDPAGWTPQEQRTVNLVKPVFDRMTAEDKEIIRDYFSCEWGKDLQRKEEISEKTLLPLSTIEIILNHAMQAIPREMGLL